NEETKIVGKILLPPQGAGKVKEGQFVNVKFDSYPHLEFGMVRAEIITEDLRLLDKFLNPIRAVIKR
ncbi:MAG: hypothetical protein FWF70_00250, partial [Bacteroidetes bacterium]|nr:hypothetical protein [Bacteroidota bacterium]